MGRRVLARIPQADPAQTPEGLIEAVDRAARSGAWPVYLWSTRTGTGKTSAAAVLWRRSLDRFAAEAERDQQWPRWATWPEFLSGLSTAKREGLQVEHETAGLHTVDERAWWNRWSTRRLVVIDEIGLGTGDFAVAAMWTLLERRRGLPTLFTGNLDAAALSEAFDNRVASRILAGTLIEVQGEDRRVAGSGKRSMKVGRSVK